MSSRERIEITPVVGPISANVRPPGSKSITNRALLCAALAKDASMLTGALDSEDTQVMVAALRELGIAIETSEDNTTIRVAGRGGDWPNKVADLYIANSGTTIRFLTAALSSTLGAFRLHGTPRMHERPMLDLAESLAQLGGKVICESPEGKPPLRIEGAKLCGGETKVRGDVSSQFLSALMMAAPLATAPVALNVIGELVSKPYVTMTAAVMKSFGVSTSVSDSFDRFEVAPQSYRGCEYAIEPDASAASYFFAAAAICGGKIAVEGLSRDSLQGDVAFADCLAKMGCRVTFESNRIVVEGGSLVGIDVDMNAFSDTAQTLAVAALFAKGPTRIRGVAHNRHKETDRIADLARELRKLGGSVEEHDDGLTISPAALHGAEIATYRDHRMAMSLALVGLKVPGVVILDPGCTEKTYPRYFEDLERVVRPH